MAGGRTSARLSREQPTSPPKPMGRPSRNAAATSLRATRSQSVDLDAYNEESNLRRGRSAGSRQGSVESTDNNVAVSRSRRVTRATAPVARDLSVVAEDRESELENEDDEDNDDTAIAEGQGSESQNDEDPEDNSERAHSPALSGTTVMTTYTDRALEGIDPEEVLDALPDLYNTAREILRLSANSNATNSSKNLKRQMKLFDANREYFGDDKFINIDIIQRRLFGPGNAEDESILPTAFLQAANLATLVSEVLEKQQINETNGDTLLFLQALEKVFPKPFVSEFSDSSLPGHSKSVNQSFEVGLSIRTQLAISIFRQEEANRNFDPDKILESIFYETGSDSQLKIIEGISFDVIDFEEQGALIVERLKNIRSTFKPAEQATGPGDYIDFEALEDQFPQSTFYDDLVQYSQVRLVEIEGNIDTQGGIENVISSLKDAVRDTESEIQVTYDQPQSIMERERDKASLTPDIRSVPARKSFYYKPSLQAFLKRKEGLQGSSAGSSSGVRPQPAPSAASSLPGPSRLVDQRQEHDKDMDQNDEITASLNAYNKERNKENRPTIEANPKLRLGDRRPNATRVEWDEDDQGLPEKPTKQKRNLKRKQPSSEEQEEDSEDEGFQNDRRIPDPARENSRARDRPMFRSRKRARTDRDEVGESSRPRKSIQSDRRGEDDTLVNEDDFEYGANSQLQLEQRTHGAREGPQPIARRSQTSRRHRPGKEPEEDTDEDEDARPLFSQIAARANTRKNPNKIQTRVPWSDEDTELLMDLIGELGCSWALIQQRGGFERNPDQGALKDRARNMKVIFLKTQSRLPINFEKIPLGQKELASVRSVIPDYEPDWR